MPTDCLPELLVVSDTHGDLPPLVRILRWAKKRGIGSFAFLGDGISDILRAFEKSGYVPVWRAVRGNGDPDADLPFERTFEVSGRRFLLTHGHLNAVQDSFDSLLFTARVSKAEAVLFGHTHYPFGAVVRGVTLVNPAARPARAEDPSPRSRLSPQPPKGRCQ